MSRWGSALAAAAVAAAALGLPPRALAHAHPIASDPTDGSSIAVAPRQIRLEFDEDVAGSLSAVVLSGARTGRVSGVVVNGSGRSLLVSVPPLDKDTYVLNWRSASADDLHPTEGTLTFGVGGVVPVATDHGPDPSRAARLDTGLGEVVLRWVDFSAIAVLIGALALLAVCLPRAAGFDASSSSAASRRLSILAVAAGTLAPVTGFALLVVQADAAAASGVGDFVTVLTTTSYGAAWVARELLIIGLLVLVLRRRGTPGWSVFTLGAALALCFALAASSHSASARGTVSVATAALGLHLFAASVWAGGVCVLAILWIRARRSKANGGEVWPLLRGFTGLAILCVSVVALTGIYSAGVDVSSPDALVSTMYGRTLLLKTGLFLVVGLIGLGNSLVVNVSQRRAPLLGRGLPLEAAAVGAVLLVAAVLTSTAPARSSTPGVARPGTSPITSLQADSLLVSLSVAPDRPGLNFLKADVYDTRRPQVAPVAGVDFAVSRGAKRPLWLQGDKVGTASWQAAGRLDWPGAWTIRLRVRRPGLPDVAVRSRWAVDNTVARVSSPPQAGSLAAIATPVAALGALALLGGLLAVFLWTRTRSATRPIPQAPQARSP
jgi:copper transport protein